MPWAGGTPPASSASRRSARASSLSLPASNGGIWPAPGRNGFPLPPALTPALTMVGAYRSRPAPRLPPGLRRASGQTPQRQHRNRPVHSSEQCPEQRTSPSNPMAPPTARRRPAGTRRGWRPTAGQPPPSPAALGITQRTRKPRPVSAVSGSGVSVATRLPRQLRRRGRDSRHPRVREHHDADLLLRGSTASAASGVDDRRLDQPYSLRR